MPRHFFDTNLLLLEKLPPGLDLGEQERWITEVTRDEVTEILGPAQVQERLAPYKLLDFDTLYEADRGACPVYYSYLAGIFNPAILSPDEFVDELFFAKTLRGEQIAPEEQLAFEAYKRRSPRGRSTLPDGTEKNPEFRKLEELTAKARKKARKAARDAHRNQLNDSRSMALMIYQMLKTKTDTVLYTADSDAVLLMLNWLSSISLHFTLIIKILKTMTEGDRQRLFRDRKLSLIFDFRELLDEKLACFRGLISAAPPVVSFTIKRWNKSNLSFENDEGFRLPAEAAEFLSQMHGACDCHFSPNGQQGNWLKYQFPGPPGLGEGPFPVEVLLKRRVTSELLAPADAHTRLCRYRREEVAGNAAFFSDFIAPVPKPDQSA